MWAVNQLNLWSEAYNGENIIISPNCILSHRFKLVGGLINLPEQVVIFDQSSSNFTHICSLAQHIGMHFCYVKGQTIKSQGQ